MKTGVYFGKDFRRRLETALTGGGIPPSPPDFSAVYREAAVRTSLHQGEGRAGRGRMKKRLLLAAAVFAAVVLPLAGFGVGSRIHSRRMAEAEMKLLIENVFDRELFPGVEYSGLLTVLYAEP